MNEALRELVDSLLYEGYALYPYTPEATKNATPTPFGIVYPPVYAAECAGAHDHARLECLTEPEPEAEPEAAAEPEPAAQLTATLCYLVPSGEGHEAREQRLQIGPVAIGERVSTAFAGGRFTLRSQPLGDGRVLVRSCVHNTTEVPAGLTRAAALAASLISTHIVVQISSGRFVSPLEAGRESVNIWPVPATEADDAILGATIVLPDHPRIASQSHGNLFDNTEIEEALVLHVHTLSEDERRSAPIATKSWATCWSGRWRSAPRRSCRCTAASPTSSPSPPCRTSSPPRRSSSPLRQASSPLRQASSPPRRSLSPPRLPPRTSAANSRSSSTASPSSVATRSCCAPGTDRDPYDRMLDGRRATIERIYIDYDDRVHLAVTVDDDPARS